MTITTVASVDLTPTDDGGLRVEVLAQRSGLAGVEDVFVVDRPAGRPGSPGWVEAVVEVADAALRERGWRTGVWAEDEDSGRRRVLAQVVRFPGLLP